MSIKRTLHDGAKDKLTPLSTLDPDQIGDFDELLTAMGRTAFGGRCLGEALDVLEAMVLDPDCVVVGTFSGAMTVAKQSKLLIKMIDEGWLDVVVSTGALMAHGFIESIGLKHFKYEPARMNDKALFDAGYNRVYDTLEPEANFAQAELVVREVMHQLMDVDKVTHLSSELICRAIGKHLSEKYNGPGILKSAYKKGVPVYIPAFTDSELALDVACSILAKDFGHLLGEKGPEALPFQFNPFLDLFSYSKKMFGAKKMAIFTIGGGVPRNWRSRSARSSTSWATAWSATCPRGASPTPSASARSRCTGAACRAAPTRRASAGASSCPRPRAASSPRSTPTPPWPGPSSSRACRTA